MRYTTTIDRNKTGAAEIDSVELEHEDAATMEAFDAKFQHQKDKLTKPIADGPSFSGSASGASGPPPGSLDPEQEKVVQLIRKAHSAWDRQKRSFQAAVAKSGGHQNTKGSAVEGQLKLVVSEGDTVDIALLELERFHMQGELWGHTQVQSVDGLLVDVKAKMQHGAKLVAVLKQWMSL